LPALDFLRLKAGSHLIDAGVDVGLPFNGTAPDLGAFEFAPPVPADFNNDGHVNAADLVVWQSGLGAGSQTNHNAGDANGDGTVDGADFLLWQSAQASDPSVSAVPEPASLVLLVIAAAATAKAQRPRA
jgi:hypothetical protein